MMKQLFFFVDEEFFLLKTQRKNQLVLERFTRKKN